MIFRDVWGPELETQATEARKNAFGPLEEMSPSKPIRQLDGTYRGGLLVERSDRAANVKDAPRAYTLGISYEVQPNLHGPAPGNKADLRDEATIQTLFIPDKTIRWPHLVQ
jgi:hypothetical protein